MENFFESLDYLEPRCPKCKTVLSYEVNTAFSEEHNAHVCLECKAVLR